MNLLKSCHVAVLFLVFSVTAGSSEISHWQLDPQASQVKFVAIADRAPFGGIFHQLQTQLALNESDLTKSQLLVTVNLASVDTQSEDGDALLKDIDFFDIFKWPQATFNSESIQKLRGNSYSSVATLTIKNIQQKLTINFNFQRMIKGKREFILLQGNFLVRRLDFDIGLGDWTNTKWVEDDVDITFNLQLIPVD